jgi:hypothetical protein
MANPSPDVTLKRKKTSVPPEDYKCNICQETGHWIQQCPQKKEHNKKKEKELEGGVERKTKSNKSSSHVAVEGVDPSEADIARAKELQKILPPRCYCGVKSRLKKVKKSHVFEAEAAAQGGGANDGDDEKQYTKSRSPAIGKYFFFCTKKKDDDTKCNFAKPLENYDATKEAYNVSANKRPKRICGFFNQEGGCKKGDSCPFAHEKGSSTPISTTTTTPPNETSDEGISKEESEQQASE